MKLVENTKYYFDAEAAERPVKFIEGYLRHYEGDHAGKPFKLLDWQKKLVRDIFGWRRRDNGKRRFREVYIETAKGSGKSPLFSAIGLYMLLCDGEQGAQVYSAAVDFKQANITFDFAKKLIGASAKLGRRCDVKQFSIIVPKTNSIWSVVSDTAEGKHGFRPTCVIMDEAHEWPSRLLYDNLTSNMVKRSNSLLIVATNAGASKTSICWQLHERAQAVIDGTSTDETLYAMIYAAPSTMAIDDPAAWKLANPSLGTTISLENLAAEAAKAKTNSALEARFRRFYLSQWIQGADKWLDMVAWDACTTDFSFSEVKDLPLYLALDLSTSDDLSALAMIWVGPKKIYLRTKHWVPKGSAIKYEERDGIPFTAWAAEKCCTLLKENTVDPDVQIRIANHIKKLAKKFNVQCLAYDRWKASLVIAEVEKAGIVCTPVEQTYKGLSLPCTELERRLKDGTIVIRPDPCLRWQASNVEVDADKMGNIRPVKEHHRGQYTGKRSSKIDGIAATVTALSRAMRHGMGDEGAPQVWNGAVVFI